MLYAGASWVVLQAAAVFGVSTGHVRWLGAGLAILYLLLLGTLLLVGRSSAEDRRTDGSRKEGPSILRGRSVAAIAILIAALGVGVWFARDALFASTVAPEANRIAVLPFSATGTGLDEYETGMVDLLAQSRRPETRVEGIRRLRLFTMSGFGPRVVRAYLALGAARQAEGDPAGAAEAYGHVIRLWGEADPWLQPVVESARRGLERVVGERGT